jgi:hypothetical protein
MTLKVLGITNNEEISYRDDLIYSRQRAILLSHDKTMKRCEDKRAKKMMMEELKNSKKRKRALASQAKAKKKIFLSFGR